MAIGYAKTKCVRINVGILGVLFFCGFLGVGALRVEMSAAGFGVASAGCVPT